MRPERVDRTGEHRTALAKNKKIILQTSDICGICGQPVDKSLRFPDPLSPTVDHIIPIAKGGHPSNLSNLQLAHLYCNTKKSDHLFGPGQEKNQDKKSPGRQSSRPAGEPGKEKEAPEEPDWTDNDNLPLHCDWAAAKW